ncbi:MAG TPA: TlpA disulfide reductase family protein [bacterium]
MKKWHLVVIIVSLALNVAVIATFGYLWAADHVKKSPFSEKELEEMKKKYASIRVVLDVPEMDPQAISFAYFDYDPIPAAKERAKNYARIYNDFIKLRNTEEAKTEFRKVYIRYMWDDVFKDIDGNAVLMLTKGGATLTSNVADKKLWVVTKVRKINDELICWCIPVMPEIGKEITVTLSKTTAYDAGRDFDNALAEASRKTVTQYPIDPNFKDEPVARALFNKMNDAFYNANAIYFEGIVWSGREGTIQNKAYYRAWLKKPNFARIEAIRDNKVTGTLICDGKYFWIYWGGKQTPFDSVNLDIFGTGQYMRIPAYQEEGRSLSHQVQLLRADFSPVYELGWFKGGYKKFNEIIDGVRSVGVEMVNGELCDVIEVSIQKNTMSRFFWVSRNDRLPRKICQIIRANDIFIYNELWTNVLINANIANSLYQWKPPAGWTQYFEPSWEDDLLKPGTIAPDFELQSIEGNSIKLSDYQGKVVLLYFWSVGCSVDELQILERIYNRFKNKNFLVIGIDNDDDYEIAKRFLNENSITYPNVIDASPAAQDIQCKQYQTKAGRRASPMTYLIDRDGKVADAWYGSDKENDEKDITNKLKKLGIK